MAKVSRKGKVTKGRKKLIAVVKPMARGNVKYNAKGERRKS